MQKGQPAVLNQHGQVFQQVQAPQVAQQGPLPTVGQVPMSQAQSQQQQQQQQNAIHQIEMEKKLMDSIVESINLITNIRDDINTIIDNVGKANSANNYSNILGNRLANGTEPFAADKVKIQPQQMSSAPHNVQQVATPSSVSNMHTQNQQNLGLNQNEQELTVPNEVNDIFNNLEVNEQEFLLKTDNKYLLDKVVDIKNCIGFV